MYNEMSVTLISVSHDTVVSNKHEERTRHYYVIFQHLSLPTLPHLHTWALSMSMSVHPVWFLPELGTLQPILS